MVTKKKVCKECGALAIESKCPVCGSDNLADKYKGTVVVLDAQNSEIAKKLNIENEGSYALKY